MLGIAIRVLVFLRNCIFFTWLFISGSSSFTRSHFYPNSPTEDQLKCIIIIELTIIMLKKSLWRDKTMCKNTKEERRPRTHRYVRIYLHMWCDVRGSHHRTIPIITTITTINNGFGYKKTKKNSSKVLLFIMQSSQIKVSGPNALSCLCLYYSAVHSSC